MVSAMIDELKITVPVALHLDHGTYEGCYKCIEAGFSSIMFDGSTSSLQIFLKKLVNSIAIARKLVYNNIGESGAVNSGVNLNRFC